MTTLRVRRRTCRTPDAYLAIAELSGPSICELVATLGDPDHLPALMFCTGEIDRTGVVIALMLGALNVDDDEIVFDYATSDDDRETMRTFLGVMQAQYGSLRTFVARHGCGLSTLGALERALLR